MVKFVHVAAIALLSAAMLPSGQAAYSCTAEISPTVRSPFLVASAADVDALNAMEFAQTAMREKKTAMKIFSLNPTREYNQDGYPSFVSDYDNEEENMAADNDFLFADQRICDRTCVKNGLNSLTTTATPSILIGAYNDMLYKGPKGVITFQACRASGPNKNCDSPYGSSTSSVEACNLYAQALNAATGQAGAEEKGNASGKKGKKNKKGKSLKEPKSPKGPKSPKEPKSPKGPKGKAAALAAKQSQAAELEVGAGVALVGMVGLVALVATKLQASVAAEDEAALLVAV